MRVRDEQTGEFFSPEDGEHTGTLYLNSESNSSGHIGQTVFFEPELIDGKPYICTNDLVRVGDSGDIFFLGRGNRYFVNNEGMKFDAGVVETAIGNQKGIAECAIVPVYEKLLVQDTVPVLYVRIAQSKSKSHDVAVVRRALKDAYLNNKTVAGNDLPWQCVIAKHLPLNDTGKVDATRIQVENTPGRTYSVVGVEREGGLVDIRLAKVKGSATPRSFAGIPKKVRKEKLAMMRDMAKAYSPDYLPQLIELFGPDALEGIMDDAQPQAQGDYTAAVPFPFLPMLYARREKDTDDELRGGLNVPKTINSIMRLLFHASNVAHDFEK